MKVCVIGAGMAGLLAAKACLDANVDYRIVAEGRPKEYGIRYLHDPCGLPLKARKIETLVQMSNGHVKRLDDVELSIVGEWYAQKTHTDPQNNSLTRSQPLIEAFNWYDAKELMYGLKVDERKVRPRDVSRLCEDNDLVVSTAPMGSLFPNASCRSRSMFISVGAPESLPHVARRYDGLIIYNLDPEVPWSRYSWFMGDEQTEWTRPMPGAVRVKKVVTSSGKVRKPGNMILTGRHGAWDSTLMAHDAYYDTLRAIDVLKNGQVIVNGLVEG